MKRLVYIAFVILSLPELWKLFYIGTELFDKYVNEFMNWLIELF